MQFNIFYVLARAQEPLSDIIYIETQNKHNPLILQHFQFNPRTCVSFKTREHDFILTSCHLWYFVRRRTFSRFHHIEHTALKKEPVDDDVVVESLNI